MSTDRMDDTLIEVPRGLTNVAVTDTAISQIHGLQGYYQYRDQSAIKLARSASFEQAWRLLVHGDLLDDDAQRQLVVEIQDKHRELVFKVVNAVGEASVSGPLDPLTGLKAALPLISAKLGMRPVYDLTDEGRAADAAVLVALVPVVLAAFHTAGAAEQTHSLDLEAGLVSRYLQQVTGEVPSGETAQALNAYLVAAMEHGFNASTFTARVIASTGADVASCLVGALGSLTGPLHGGAPARALDTLDEVADVEDLEAWLRREVTAGRRLMGFGHPVYRTVDPRSRMLQAIVTELGGPRVEAALHFEQTAERVLSDLKPGRALHANIEFYAAVLMERCGIPRAMFTPTFAVARMVGWSAHILEQAREGKIMRPSARFLGPTLS